MDLDPYRPPSDTTTTESQPHIPEARERPTDHAGRRWINFGAFAFIAPLLDVAGIALTGLISELWTALDNLWIYCWLFPAMLIGGAIAVWVVGRPRLGGAIAYCVVGTLLTWFNFRFFWGVVASV